MLLSNLGVPDEVFLNLQRAMLDSLAGKGVPQSSEVRPNLLASYADAFLRVFGYTDDVVSESF